jgi:two-component system response regulator HydG
MAERKRLRVLVVDDHIAMAELVADGLSDLGYDAVAVGSGREGLKRLTSEPFDALVTDLRMPDVDGLELLATAKKAVPERPVIVMTAHGAVDTAIESIRRGAYHYLTKPFNAEELALFLARAFDEATLRRETTALKRTLRDRYSIGNLVGKSAAMQTVCDLAERVAGTDVPILLTGETGTGKSVLARAIHASGGRGSEPFITVSCAALPENLLETELFGHVKGAFTGASSARAGLFIDARGGTIFLDEIGEMPLPLQAKLLDVLERGVVRAVGSTRETQIDARIVTATHRDLRELALAGRFREDLLYRLDVVTIEIPPLRHRRDDLPLLIDHFLAAAKDRHPRSPIERIAPDAMARLLEHAWPGNVRELEHVIERLVILATKPEITLAQLPPTLGAAPAAVALFEGPVLQMREVQRRYAAWAYEQLGARKYVTAEKLGIDYKTLVKWLELEENAPSKG